MSYYIVLSSSCYFFVNVTRVGQYILSVGTDYERSHERYQDAVKEKSLRVFNLQLLLSTGAFCLLNR